MEVVVYEQSYNKRKQITTRTRPYAIGSMLLSMSKVTINESKSQHLDDECEILYVVVYEQSYNKRKQITTNYFKVSKIFQLLSMSKVTINESKSQLL